MTRAGRIATLTLALAAWPWAARADILIVPFFGGAFGSKAVLPLFGPVTEFTETTKLSKSIAVGVSGVWLTRGIIGAEAELAHFPRFFEPTVPLSRPSAFDRSSITSISGNLILAMPLSVTRESLRPYLVGGFGVLHSGINDVTGAFGFDRNIVALNVGGGAIGMLSRRTGVRFDLRRTRSLRDVPAPTNLMLTAVPGDPGGTGIRLSYWRATVGVTFRY